MNKFNENVFIFVNKRQSQTTKQFDSVEKLAEKQFILYGSLQTSKLDFLRTLLNYSTKLFTQMRAI